MSGHRAVITGVGCVSAIGNTAAETWAGLKEGRSGIGPLEGLDHADLRIKTGGQVKGDITEGLGLEQRRLNMYDRFSLLAIKAAKEALADSGLEISEENATRVGTVVGVGVCGWEAIEDGYRRVFVENQKRTNVWSVPRAMPSAASCHVSMQLGLKGPSYGVSSACSSSNHALHSALQMIRSGTADAILVGGTEAPMIWGILKAWEMLRIVAPDTCRPFSLDRKGLILAEGAGLVVLESLEHAKARGATIHAELAGVGMSADAADIVTPSDEGPTNAMKSCLADAQLNPEDVHYINAHGTGTKANDSIETRVIRDVFGAHADSLSVSSTKSMHGHPLGAAGALELVACIHAIKEGVVPPTANYNEPDPECDLDVTPNESKERPVDVALSNAFAFGGLNAVAAVKRFAD